MGSLTTQCSLLLLAILSLLYRACASAPELPRRPRAIQTAENHVQPPELLQAPEALPVRLRDGLKLRRPADELHVATLRRRASSANRLGQPQRLAVGKQPPAEAAEIPAEATLGTSLAGSPPPSDDGTYDSAFTAAMEIGNNTKGDLEALLLNIGISASFCVICFMSMSWLRLHFPLTYSNNVVNRTAPFRPAETFLGWVWASLTTTALQAQETSGLDMAMLIQFHAMSFWVLLLIGAPFVVIMCPLYYFHGGLKAEVDNLSKIGIGCIKDQCWLWWVVAGAVWYVVATVHFVLFMYQRSFVAKRFQWLKDMPEPRSSSVLVTGIPISYCTDARLKEYFNTMFGDGDVVEEAFIVKHTRPLRQLIQERDDAIHRLEVAQATWKKQGGGDETRPRVFANWQYQDAIGYWTAEVDRLKKAVTVERADVQAKSAAVVEKFAVRSPSGLGKIETDEKGHPIDPEHIRSALYQLSNSIAPNTTNGFVTFTRRHYQAMAVQMQFRADDEEFLCEVPPDPADVLYSSFLLDDSQASLYHLVGYGWLMVIFLAYMPFVLKIAVTMNIERLSEYSDTARYIVDNYPGIAAAYDGMMGSIGIEIAMCFLPTTLALIFNTFWPPKAGPYLQVYLQNWYFVFLLTFVVLITGLGESLYDRLKQTIRSPLEVLAIFFATMPATSHFYMNYLVLNSVAQGMVLTRYVNLLKYIGWRALFDQATARTKSEPEDPDYYGIGSRSARHTLMLSICLVFCTISPVILVIGLVYFCWTRLIYGYLLVFAESRKSDLGGVFWCQQINHIHVVLWIYGILMAGVCTARGPRWQCGLIPFAAMLAHASLCSRFHHRFKWEFLPFEANVAFSAEFHREKSMAATLSQQQGFPPVPMEDEPRYQQPELEDD